MSHEVETMAWTNEVPWHGLGTKVPENLTVEQMLEAAQINWTVSKKPMFIKVAGKQIAVPDHFALTRDTDSSVLDVVGKAYVPTQNAQAFEFFREFVEAGSAKLDTAGSLRGGRIVWGLANLNESFTLKKGSSKDVVNGHLLVTSPHQQGRSKLFLFTAIRVVCNNTLTAALGTAISQEKVEKGGIVRVSHRREFNTDRVEEAKKALGIAREQFEEFHDATVKLVNKKMAGDDAVRFLAQVLHEEIADQPIKTIRDDANKQLAFAIAALEKSPGADLATANGTAWGALNAITYMTDHMIGKSPDRRLDRAWLGQTAKLKRKALDMAMAA